MRKLLLSLSIVVFVCTCASAQMKGLLFDTVNVKQGTETSITLPLSGFGWDAVENFSMVKEGENSMSIKPLTVLPNQTKTDFVLKGIKYDRRITMVYNEDESADFQFDLRNRNIEIEQKDATKQLTVIDQGETGEKTIQGMGCSTQRDPIPYALQEISSKFPNMNLGVLPDEQVLNLAYDDKNKQADKVMCDNFREENSKLNIVFSNDQVEDIRLVCQDIKFNNANAMLKLMIQNIGAKDFLTGMMFLKWKKKDQTEFINIYPEFFVPTSLPIVKPKNQFSLIFPFHAFNIMDEDELWFEMHDREKKINVEFKIDGSVYNKARNLN